MTALTYKELLQKREDLSPFLFHLTRSGSVKLWKDIYQTPLDRVISVNARDNLIKIIQDKRISGVSPFGYFNYKVPLIRPHGTTLNPGSHVRRDWLRAACFTETPLDHVHLQMKQIYGRSLHFESFGLAFKEEVVRAANGNPIFYAQTSNSSLRRAFDDLATDPLAVSFKAMMPLVEGFGAPWFPKPGGPSEIDFRWEREWRVAGDFSFSETDIAFGLCPTVDIPFFEALLGNSVPFVDPQADLAAAKKRLRTYVRLKDLK